MSALEFGTKNIRVEFLFLLRRMFPEMEIERICH